MPVQKKTDEPKEPTAPEGYVRVKAPSGHVSEVPEEIIAMLEASGYARL